MNTNKMGTRMRQRIEQRRIQKQKKEIDRTRPIIDGGKKIIDGIIRTKTNIGFLLSLVAFFVILIPPAYQLVDSIRVFLAALQEAQKRLVLLHEENSALLRQVVESPSISQVTYDDSMMIEKLECLLEKFEKMEEAQTEFFKNDKKTDAIGTGDDGVNDVGDAGDGEQLRSEVWGIGPPPATEDCETGTCPVIVPQNRQVPPPNKTYQQRQGFRLF